MTMPKVDVETAVALKEGGMSIPVIAAFLGVHRTTVYKHLKPLGLIEPIHRKETCARGHSMDDAIIKENGYRGCRTCKKERDAAWHRAKYWARKASVD